MRSHLKATGGFAILTAIFILVVLAVLGAGMLTISTNQQIGAAQDLQGVRAYQAARAGIEWGLYRVQATTAYNFSYGSPATAVGAANPNLRACPAATTSFALAAGTLTDFTVTVTCAATTDVNGGPTLYSVVATACNQPVAGWTGTTVACPNTTDPGSLYVERRIAAAF